MIYGKKLTRSIVPLVISILIISLHSAFAAEGDVWLIPATQHADKNQNITVQVYLDAGVKELGAFDIYFDFDPQSINVRTEMGVDGVENKIDAVLLTNPTDLQNGHLRIGAIAATGLTGSAIHLMSIYIKTTSSFTSNETILSVRVNEISDTLGWPLTPGTVSHAIVKYNMLSTGYLWILLLP